jgi:hypothetical protein
LVDPHLSREAGTVAAEEEEEEREGEEGAEEVEEASESITFQK